MTTCQIGETAHDRRELAPGESPAPASDARPPFRSDTLARDGALTGGLEGEAIERSRYRSRMRVLLPALSTAVGGRRFTVEDVKGEDAASLSRALARAKGVYVTSEARETARRRPARATTYTSLARETVLRLVRGRRPLKATYRLYSCSAASSRRSRRADM